MNRDDIKRVANTETTAENWELIRQLLTALWDRTEPETKKKK